jgi:hypothetical protein
MKNKHNDEKELSLTIEKTYLEHAIDILDEAITVTESR